VDECTAVVSVSGSRVAMTASKGQSAGRVSAIPAFDTIMNRKRSGGRSDDLLRLIAKVLRSAVLGVEISETQRVRVKARWARSGDGGACRS
jgi:hypothetical protein